MLALWLVPASFVARHNSDADVKSYVETHLSQIIERQEKKLGIGHFGVPKVSYEYPPWVTDEDKASAAPGGYGAEEDTIYIPLEMSVTPEFSLTNAIRNVAIFGNVFSVEKTLEHELGHFYADKLSECLGKERSFSDQAKHQIAAHIVSEGIAEYFQRALNDGQDDFKDSDWPRTPAEFLTEKVIYSGGFHIVKPIIDRYGTNGIMYLISNLPHEENLNNLQNYQSRVLQNLSNQNMLAETVRVR